MLSVVIPCHNGIEDTRACLHSLSAQTGLPPWEVVLVDNGSQDGTAGLAEEFAGVTVCRQQRNLGFAAGANAGLRVARGQWIAVINNDTMAAPDLLLRLWAAARHDARIGFVAPVSNHVKGPAHLEVGAAGESETGRRELVAELDAAWGDRLQDVDNLAGLCLFAHRRVWTQLSGFDERFGLGNFEDDDLSFRARLLGYRLVIARAAFLHHRGHGTFRRLGIDYGRQLRHCEARFEAKWRRDPAGAVHLAAHRGDLDGAAAGIGRAQRCYPAWPDAGLVLARWYASRGDHARACLHTRSFLARCPNDDRAALLLGQQLIAAGSHADGVAQLHRVLESGCVSAPERCNLRQRLAHHHLGRGDPGAAISELGNELALTPDSADLHNLLGAALLETGDTEPARRSFATAACRGSNQALTNLGICLWQQGNPRQAVKAMALAVQRAPGDGVARANLEQACAALGVSCPDPVPPQV